MLKTTLVSLAALTLTLAAGGIAGADAYSPPADYYDTATGTGATLKSQLHIIISRDYWTPGSTTHRVLSYTAQAPIAMAVAQRPSDDPSYPHQLLLYTGQLWQKNWDAGATWNREHSWPQSRGVGNVGPDFSDVHHLKSAATSVNSARSNKPYGTGGTEWDPNALGGHDRGECARAMFYMDTRYDGGEADTVDLVLVSGSPGANQMGDLTELLQWHYDEPPSQFERRRNQVIFSNNPWDWEDTQINPEVTLPGFERPPLDYHQGNRNPFVDHPEFVWTIWGSGPNNSTLYVGGGFNADGSSATNVDLGRVILGSDATSTVTLNRAGTHPTTWITTVTGDALSDNIDLPGTFPFTVAPPSIPQPVVSVGIDGSAGYGVRTGDVVVNNTDLTSAAFGQGAQDADDVISVQAEVVDHANGSFSNVVDLNSTTINFGSVPQNSGPAPISASLWNLPSGSGFTAALDVDSVSGSGDTAVVTINLAPSVNLAAGQARNFQASVNSAAAPGAYQSVYTIALSDENIPGATALGVVTLTVQAVIAPACTGDVNGDGMTNAGDFTVLAGNYGNGPGMTRAQGDLNGDGFVNASDFTILAGDYGCQ